MDANHSDPDAKHSRLEEIERNDDSRPPFILTRTELKLLGIAGVSRYRMPGVLSLTMALHRLDSFSMVRFCCRLGFGLQLISGNSTLR